MSGGFLLGRRGDELGGIGGFGRGDDEEDEEG